MGAENIVCWPNVGRYHGNNPKLVEKYREIIKKGECPFCPDNIKGEGRELVAETDLWNIIKNQYPYPNSALHLLIIPKRHVIDQLELTPGELVEMAEAIGIIAENYPDYLSKGYGLAVRVGEIGGVTLYHLHWHLIVPKVDPQTGQIAVNFGIG